jgi:hypothetical protein
MVEMIYSLFSAQKYGVMSQILERSEISVCVSIEPIKLEKQKLNIKKNSISAYYIWTSLLLLIDHVFYEL